MADLAAPAPFEPEKSTSLHDRAERPKAPAASTATQAKRFAEGGLALLLTVGFVALLFQTRATWEGQRDWVVPATVPLAVISAIALAGLLMRKQMIAAGPGLLFLAFALGLTGANIGGAGSGRAQDVLTITTAVLLGIAAACFLIAFVIVEWTRPFKAPAPEM